MRISQPREGSAHSRLQVGLAAVLSLPHLDTRSLAGTPLAGLASTAAGRNTTRSPHLSVHRINQEYVFRNHPAFRQLTQTPAFRMTVSAPYRQ